MQLFHYFCFLFLSIFSITTAHAAATKEPSLEAVQSLSEKLGLRDSGNLLQEIQKYWMRRPGSERFEMLPLKREQQHLILSWAKDHSLIHEWYPPQKKYDYIAVFGARINGMIHRIRFLEKILEEGVDTKEIIFMTGMRPLGQDEKYDAPGCDTEYDAAKYLWKTQRISKKTDKIKCRFICVDMQETTEGMRRPNTRDVVLEMAKHYPPSAKYLFVSSQPFCYYQKTIVEHSLPKEYDFDVAGERFCTYYYVAPAAVVLDTLTRILYEKKMYSSGF